MSVQEDIDIWFLVINVNMGRDGSLMYSSDGKYDPEMCLNQRLSEDLQAWEDRCQEQDKREEKLTFEERAALKVLDNLNISVLPGNYYDIRRVELQKVSDNMLCDHNLTLWERIKAPLDAEKTLANLNGDTFEYSMYMLSVSQNTLVSTVHDADSEVVSWMIRNKKSWGSINQRFWGLQ